MTNRFFALVSSVILMICLCGCNNEGNTSVSCEISTENSTDNNSDYSAQIIGAGEFTVTVLSVGKADSIVLQTQNHTAIIDTATNDMSDTILDFLSDNNIETIDCMILTHFDKDHCGGASDIIKNITVDTVYQPDYDGTSNEWEKYVKAADKHDCNVVRVSDEITFTLDDTQFVINPYNAEFTKGDDNNFSLVTSCYHGENSFLFAGDIEDSRINQLVADGIGEYTFLKVPHHGFYASQNEKLINAVKPKYAVISCKEKSACSPDVFNFLNNAGAEVYLTQNGNVTCTSDGKTITIKQ